MIHTLCLRGERWLPLLLLVGYVAFTFGVFLFGPIDWGVDNVAQLSLFLLACMVLTAMGYAAGLRRPLHDRSSFPWRRFYWAGGIASVLLLTPNAWIYTQHMPWHAFTMAGCQNTAYLGMLAALEDSNSTLRMSFALLRGMLAPLTFSVLPIALLYWSRLRRAEFLLLGLYLLSVISMSLLRGTDKETFDVLIVMLACLPLLGVRSLVLRTMQVGIFYQLLAVTVALFIVAGWLFVERKEARLMRSYPILAANTDQSCDLGQRSCMCSQEKSLFKRQAAGLTFLYSGEMKFLPADRFGKAYIEQLKQAGTSSRGFKSIRSDSFALFMASSYLSQGYFGLSLALKQDFTSTYGLGHSVLLMNYLGDRLDPALRARAYTEKIAADWNPKHQWSTAFAWFANDVGFVGVPLFMAAFGFVLAMVWRQATHGLAEAGVLFALFMIGIFYLPANNQLFMAIDSYFSVLFWLGYWMVMRYRANSSFR